MKWTDSYIHTPPPHWYPTVPISHAHNNIRPNQTADCSSVTCPLLSHWSTGISIKLTTAPPTQKAWDENPTPHWVSLCHYNLVVSCQPLTLLEKSNSEFLLSLSLPLQIHNANCFPKAFFHYLILHSQAKLPISSFTKKNRYNPVKMTNFTVPTNIFTIFAFYSPHPSF